jgi:hypothetical protein
MIEWIHRRGFVKWILAALGIAFAAYFAWSFFPFGDWVGKTFLQDAPGGPQVLGWISAVILGGLVLIVVFWKEYIKEDTQAYSEATGDTSFINAFKWFVWFVIGLEAFSVLFRAILIHFSPLALVILGVGMIGMGVTYIVGKLLHVQVNRPPAVAARHLRQTAQRQTFEDGEKMVKKKKFSIAQMLRIGTGDHGPIQEIRDEEHGARAREQAVKAAQIKAAEDERRRDEEFYHKMTSPPEQPTPTIGSNGRQPNP